VGSALIFCFPCAGFSPFFYALYLSFPLLWETPRFQTERHPVTDSRRRRILLSPFFILLIQIFLAMDSIEVTCGEVRDPGDTTYQEISLPFWQLTCESPTSLPQPICPEYPPRRDFRSGGRTESWKLSPFLDVLPGIFVSHWLLRGRLVSFL